MPSISVIVPARDAEALLERTLVALRAQRGVEDYEVIVVDNGSRDATAELAERHADRVVRRPRGEGPGAARNAGAAASAAPLLAFTDADCVPTAGWLAAGLRCLEGAELVQGAVAPDPSASPGPFDRSLWVDRPGGLFESASLFVTRRAFDAAGGFPAGLEGEGAPFGEDTRFGWAVRRTGASSVFCADALVHHAVLPRGAVAFVAERWRLRLFPRLVAEVPELRAAAAFGRIFLSRRTAAFDLALAGALLPRRRLLALPYALLAGRSAAGWGRSAGPRMAAASVAADAVGLAALLWGSVRARRLLV